MELQWTAHAHQHAGAIHTGCRGAAMGAWETWCQQAYWYRCVNRPLNSWRKIKQLHHTLIFWQSRLWCRRVFLVMWYHCRTIVSSSWRFACEELMLKYHHHHILPAYCKLQTTSFLYESGKDQFEHWTYGTDVFDTCQFNFDDLVRIFCGIWLSFHNKSLTLHLHDADLTDIS